jgi:hypothetical protein
MNSKYYDIRNFTFVQAGYGHYLVTYTYPSGKEVHRIIDDMRVIDKTHGSDNPQRRDLITLRNLVVRGRV